MNIKERENAVFDMLKTSREEIKKKLEEADKTGKLLKRTVEATQKLAQSLSDKINKETKLARKTYLQISKKLREAVLIIDGEGRIIRLNAAGEKLFGVNENDVLGQQFSNVVASVNPVTLKGQSIEFPLGFFGNLSEKIIDRVNNCKAGENKHGVCNTCVGEMVPEYIYPDRETTFKIRVPHFKRALKLNVVFSILNNDPENTKEVTYVFIFTKFG